MSERKEIIKRKERTQLVVKEFKRTLARVIEDFLDKGLLGKHELQVVPPIATKSAGRIEGKISGSLFGFSGFITGGTESQPSVRFAWITNNEKRELIISEVPADKFVIQQEEGKERPTVQFELNTPKFIKVRHEEKSPVGFELSTSSHPHPNDYLHGDNLRVARITLSQKDFEKLQALEPRKLLTGASNSGA